MKKILFLLVVCFGLTTPGNAQSNTASLKSEIKADKKMGESGKSDKLKARKELRKLEGNEVSYNSTQAFETIFPHVKPLSSERLNNFDEFDFMKDGQKTAAFFDDNSKLVATTEKKTYLDLPAKSREFIAKKYKDYEPVNVLYLDDNENNLTDMILFNTQFEPQDSYFVEMYNGFKAIALQVNNDGGVYYFARVF